MFKKISDFIVMIIKKIKFEIQCKKADDMWYFMGGNCFGAFPPSFYMKHTPEEAERIKKEAIKELEDTIEDLKKKERHKNK